MTDKAGRLTVKQLFGACVLLAVTACATGPEISTRQEDEPSLGKGKPAKIVGAKQKAATESNRPPPSTLDAGHARASAGVRGLGLWLDRLFGDEDYEAEVNESRLRLRVDSFTEQYEGIDAKVRARLYLKLPALGERVRAEVLSASEPQDPEASGAGDAGAAPNTNDQRDVSAALSYFFRNDKKRSLSARLGAKFDGYRPDPFAGLRYRRNAPIGEKWNFRFIERLRFYSLKGFESVTSFNLDRGLTRDRLFRSGISGTWLHEEENFSYDVGFALYEPLAENEAVEYQLVNSFGTNPHELNNVTLRFRHRKPVWRDWLYFEVAPQVSFPRDRDYEPVPGIMLRLEATFGG